jgi:DNA-directed RNA polymerase specialized sigma24 family protein
MKKDEDDSTNSLLRVIVALLLRRKDEQLLPLKQQVQILDDLGLRPTEIAKILGRSSTYVNKELVGIRKSSKRG